MLNRRFYEAEPWTYFRRRLSLLAEVADPESELSRPTTPKEFTVGRVTVALTPSADDGRSADVSSRANTNFSAAEGEVLLHHTSETLLRLALAHLPTSGGSLPACPWFEVARLRAFQVFKKSIKERFVLLEDEAQRRAQAAILFGDATTSRAPVEDRLGELVRYLEFYARVFLDSDAYNAAKHGFVLQAEHSAADVQVEGQSIMAAAGPALTYLHKEGAEWTLTTRWYSLEATLALIYVATNLIEALWYRARMRYLGEGARLAYTPPPLDALTDHADGDVRRLMVMSQRIL